MTESIADLYEKGISTASTSKAFSLAGLRLGWIVGPADFLTEIALHRDYDTISVSMVDDYFATMAMQNRDKILAKTMAIVQRNLVLLKEFFSRHEDVFEWHPPRAGTVGFLRVKGALLQLGDGGASGFCEELLAKKQVLFLPASKYEFRDEFVRIGFGRANLAECLPPLEEFLKDIK